MYWVVAFVPSHSLLLSVLHISCEIERDSAMLSDFFKTQQKNLDWSKMRIRYQQRPAIPTWARRDYLLRKNAATKIQRWWAKYCQWIVVR
tara:strand:+ start:451 stop:720 length:270 start_codon:yes stop_codon:yes gene_type:complete